MKNTDIDNTNDDAIEKKYIPRDGENIIELIPDDGVRKPDTWFFHFTVIIAVIPSLAFGAGMGWFSPVMVKLESNDTSINPLGRPITTNEVSLFFAIPGLLSLIGTSILPKMVDLFGRKMTLMVYCFGVLFFTIGLAFGNNIILIIMFNSLPAMLISAYFSTAPIYLTEICENHNRAKFGCLLTVFVPFGELIAFIIGPMFSYRDFTLLTAALLIPFLLCFFLAPESPVYVLTKGETQKCKSILKKLRSNKTLEELDHDFNEISTSLKLDSKIEGSSIVKLFQSEKGRKGIILASIPSMIQIFCGVPIVMSLLAPIFNQSGSNLSGDTIAIIVGVAKTVSFLFTSLVIEKLGRRKLLIASSFGMGLAISVLGVFFYLNSIKSPVIIQFRWVPLVGVLVYIVAYSIGIGPIALVTVGELFVAELRTTAFSFLMTNCAILFTIYSATYPFAAAAIGIHWCMGIFGAACFVGGILIYKLIPETKGKSILEIQKLLI